MPQDLDIIYLQKGEDYSLHGSLWQEEDEEAAVCSLPQDRSLKWGLIFWIQQSSA